MIVSPGLDPRQTCPGSATLPFLADVLRGLRSLPKMLPSKYFYDEAGSELFEQITTLEEYYLTRAELAIMEMYASEMTDLMGERCLLIEYGSGSSIKTRLLFDQIRDPAGYIPIDVSWTFLHQSAQALSECYPKLPIAPVCADFTQPRHFALPSLEHARKVVYFPGSTIGNLTPDQATSLLHQTAELVGPGGGLLLGVDLKKDTHVLEMAYNDRRGVTAAFNRNLLVRINRELGANIAVERFAHRAFYNASQGRIEMHLVSADRQRVAIGAKEFRFVRGESICTEYSYKYEWDDLHALAEAAGFKLLRGWTDENHLFSVSYWTIDPSARNGDIKNGRTRTA